MSQLVWASAQSNHVLCRSLTELLITVGCMDVLQKALSDSVFSLADQDFNYGSPPSILLKSISDRYQPNRNPVQPITVPLNLSGMLS